MRRRARPGPPPCYPWPVLPLLLLACRIELGPPEQAASGQSSELWLYTSMYEEVLATLRPMWERDLPDLRIEVYQAGSEKVAQRFEAELAAGGSRACVLASSDPAWTADLAERELLHPYLAPATARMDRRWLDPQGRYFTMRLSLMVLASAQEAAPTSFRDLSESAWAGQVSSPDPLASGTAFTTWSALDAAYGPQWVAAARGQGLIAQGGNSSVLARMESGERPVGVILLENLLLKPDSAARAILPTDGAIPVPGPVAIPRGCPDVHGAERFVAWLMSDPAQQAIVQGGMHSPLPHLAPPPGGPPLAEIPLFPVPADIDAAAFKARWVAP